MITSWIDVENRLPEKDGTYICCVKNTWNGETEYDVQTLHFAKKLCKTNTRFSEPELHDIYDHPGFYFLCGNHWDAEEIPYYGDGDASYELQVTHWMEYPDAPFNT